MNISFAASGDERSIRSSRERLVRRACVLVGPCDAEDVVHDAFERALRSHTLRSDRDAGPWLQRIARNAGIDLLRAGTRRAKLPLASVTESESAERTVLRNEATHEIGGALQTLPAEQRRTLVLHDVEGYSNHEIAELDGISYHTVRTRLFRARRAMRDVLAPVAA